MSNPGVMCTKQGCNTPATNVCSRCRLVYYCSRACQVSHYPLHKKRCRELAAQEQEAIGGARPVQPTPAEELVAAVAKQLASGQGVPPATSVPLEDSPLKDLETLAGSSFANEKRLGKAGACEVLASAFDRALDGSGPVSVYHLCSAIIRLTLTCAKNRIAFGRLGIIASATKALTRATSECDWPLAVNACFLLDKIAIEEDAAAPTSRCSQLGAVGAFEAAAACVVAGVRACMDSLASRTPPSPDAMTASYHGCEAVHDLQYMAQTCTDAGCQNKTRLGRAPGLFPALEACLKNSLMNMAWMVRLDTMTSLPSRPPPEVITESFSNIHRVCHGLVAFLQQPSPYPDTLVRSLLTPSVYEGLACALATVATAGYREARPRCDSDWKLVSNVSKLIAGACLRQSGRMGIPRELSDAAAKMLDVIKAANADRVHSFLPEAMGAVSLLLGRDPHAAVTLVEKGACDAFVEVLRQAVDRLDLGTARGAIDAIGWLIADDDSLRLLARGPDTCQVLVRSLEFLLAAVGQGREVAAFPANTWARWVDFWLEMVVAQPRCKAAFRSAGACDVLKRAAALPVVARNADARGVYRRLLEELG
eukprot:jgi/Mesvir1/13558/Mv12447-RA.1